MQTRKHPTETSSSYFAVAHQRRSCFPAHQWKKGHFFKLLRKGCHHIVVSRITQRAKEFRSQPLQHMASLHYVCGLIHMCFHELFINQPQIGRFWFIVTKNMLFNKKKSNSGQEIGNKIPNMKKKAIIQISYNRIYSLTAVFKFSITT